MDLKGKLKVTIITELVNKSVCLLKTLLYHYINYDMQKDSMVCKVLYIFLLIVHVYKRELDNVIIDFAEIVDTAITEDSNFKLLVNICKRFHFCAKIGQRLRSFSNLVK